MRRVAQSIARGGVMLVIDIKSSKSATSESPIALTHPFIRVTEGWCYTNLTFYMTWIAAMIQ